MLKNQLVSVLLLVLSKSVLAFDYSAYPLQNVDEIITEGRAMATESRTGVEIMIPPKKFSFDGRLESLPSSCKPDFLFRVMRVQGFTPEQLPPINNCLLIRSPRGEVLTAFIQDTVAAFLKKEVQAGAPVRFYVMYVFFGQKTQLPVFLVSEFQAANDAAP